MICIVTQNYICDMLVNPHRYITSYTDEIILKDEKPNEPTVMLMLGYDEEKKSYYFVLEDDYTSEDIYCEKENLVCKFNEIVAKLQKGDKNYAKLGTEQH